MTRTALLGVGGIGMNLAHEVADHPDGDLVALVDVDPDRVAAAGETFDDEDPVLFTEESAMYEATSDLDAVIIATPPAFHDDSIRTAFDRGCHVLCEKPVVMDLGAARDLTDLVSATDRVLMAGYQRHLNPGFVHARERWVSGPDPTFITGELTQDWRHHFETGTNWRLDPAIGGGGHLFSVGTHVVESVLWMTGLTPKSVAAEMDFYDEDERIDTQASLSVQFEEGTVASLSDSAVTPTTGERIRIWDDDGVVSLSGRDWDQRRLAVLDESGDDATPAIEYDATPTKFAAFVDAIENDHEPPATADDVLRVTALLEAAYESARTGERVAVDLDG